MKICMENHRDKLTVYRQNEDVGRMYARLNSGEYCKVDFKKFLRPEQKFSSLEALKAQLERDAVKGQEYFETL